MNKIALSREAICAIIVTYNPKKDFSKNIIDFITQFNRIVIIDNASSSETLEELNELKKFNSVVIIVNSINKGIGAALNQGIRLAFEMNYKWALTLDQDSLPSNQMLIEQIIVYEKYSPQKLIGIIGANPIDSKTGQSPYRFIYTGNPWSEQKVLITSGCLMPLVPYKIVGPFREDFFIDGVDQEYCLRLRHYGYKVILAHNAIMTHSLGSPIIKTFLGKVFIPTNHSSLRYYYFIRNGIYIARIYFFSESRWVTRHLFAQFKLVFKIILFEHEKVEKLKMVFLGFCHALSGKLGSLQVR